MSFLVTASTNWNGKVCTESVKTPYSTAEEAFEAVYAAWDGGADIVVLVNQESGVSHHWNRHK